MSDRVYLQFIYLQTGKYGEMKPLKGKEEAYLCVATLILGITLVIRTVEGDNLLLSAIIMVYRIILTYFLMFAVYSANRLLDVPINPKATMKEIF